LPRDAASRPPLHAGERWRFTVRLKIPYGTHNPHGFDLEAWMLEQGIAASGYVRERPPPRRLDARAATPAAWIAATREALRNRILTTLGEAP
jgi:competence protein ComEC